MLQLRSSPVSLAVHLLCSAITTAGLHGTKLMLYRFSSSLAVKVFPHLPHLAVKHPTQPAPSCAEKSV